MRKRTPRGVLAASTAGNVGGGYDTEESVDVEETEELSRKLSSSDKRSGCGGEDAEKADMQKRPGERGGWGAVVEALDTVGIEMTDDARGRGRCTRLQSIVGSAKLYEIC